MDHCPSPAFERGLGDASVAPGSASEAPRADVESASLEAENARLVAENLRLEAENARLRAVLAHAPVGIVFADAATGRVIDGNRRAEELLGHPVQPGSDDDGYRRWKLLDADDRPLSAEHYPIARAVRDRRRTPREAFRYLRGDGRRVWIGLSAAPVFDAAGGLVGGVVTIADIDDDKRIEARQRFLLDVQELLRAHGADGVGAVAELLGRRLGVIRVGCGDFRADGSSFDSAVLWSAPDAPPMAPQLPLQRFEAVRDRLAPGHTVATRDILGDPVARQCAEGYGELGVRASVIVPALERGRLAAALFVHDARPRDWSADDIELVEAVAVRALGSIRLARAQAALAESEARFRGLAESLPQLVWSSRADGHTDYFNSCWYDFTGTAPGSGHGSDWLEVFHPDDRALLMARWRHSVRTGEFYEMEYRLRHRDGSYRWILGRGVPLRDADGAVTRWFGTCTDIDDQIRARESLARFGEALEQQVTARTAELSAANDRLREEMQERQRAEERLRQSQKMEAVGQLTGGIAHDFNNLLTGILGSLTLVRKRLQAGRGEDAERFIASATQSARRAAGLVQRLLAFSRQQALDPRAVDVDALARSLVDLFRRTLGERIRLHARLAAAPLRAWSDENQLEAALVNLVINARDAMPDGGDLTIATAVRRVGVADAADGPEAMAAVPPELAPGTYLRLAVTDTGSGMSPDVLARVFEPFFTTKPVGQGTGLGLSMVYGFARQSGGTVCIDSRPGEGSTVAIWLPCEASPREAAPVSPTVDAPATGPVSGSVLLVEDDEGVRAMVEGLLADAGLRVLVAGEAGAALAIVDGGATIDLLVSDVGLPGLNGRQLAEAVRQRRPALPVLFMTGYAERAATRVGTLPECCELLAKPFDAEALAGAIRRLLAAGR